MGGGRSRTILLSLLAVTLIIGPMLFLVVRDAIYYPMFYTPPYPDCTDYLIIDPLGFVTDEEITSDDCYVDRMTVEDFLGLGNVRAKRLIIVAHYFSSVDAFGVSTSEAVSILSIIKHPIASFFLVKGDAGDGLKVLAVGDGISTLPIDLSGKELVFIACSYNFELMVEELVSMGAETVAVANNPALPVSLVNYYTKNALELGDQICESEDFKCFNS